MNARAADDVSETQSDRDEGSESESTTGTAFLVYYLEETITSFAKTTS